MTDACSHQLLKVTPHNKSAPVAQHSGFVYDRVQQLSIGPLVHHPVLQISNIDCLKEHWSDPWLEKKPTSKIDPSNDVVITTLRLYLISFNKYLIALYLLFGELLVRGSQGRDRRML